ncbi:hypothetical protein BHM03_00008228 [Ensete ventricosum]|nr:hypothetical protein BHM03_00008228 [Ensete ventricosum]
MKEVHDCCFVVTLRQLEEQRARFQVPLEFILFVPGGEAHPFHHFCEGLCLSIDAIKAVFCLSLPPVVASYLGYWRIFPSQIKPNYFLRVFLRACDTVEVASSHDIFCLCFRLSRGSSSYYMSPHTRFKISGAAYYSKGWRSHFFIIDGIEDWGLSMVWAAHTVNNTLPVLSMGETEALEKI